MHARNARSAPDDRHAFRSVRDRLDANHALACCGFRTAPSRRGSASPQPSPLRSSVQIVTFQLFVERSQPDAELRRGQTPVATDGRERALDRLAFQVRQRAIG